MTKEHAGLCALIYYCWRIEMDGNIWSRYRSDKDGKVNTTEPILGVPFPVWAKFHLRAIDYNNNLKRLKLGLETLPFPDLEEVANVALEYAKARLWSDFCKRKEKEDFAFLGNGIPEEDKFHFVEFLRAEFNL